MPNGLAPTANANTASMVNIDEGDDAPTITSTCPLAMPTKQCLMMLTQELRAGRRILSYWVSILVYLDQDFYTERLDEEHRG